MNVLKKIKIGGLSVTCGVITLIGDPRLFPQWDALRARIWGGRYMEPVVDGVERTAEDYDGRTVYIVLVRVVDGVEVVVGGCRIVYDTFGKGTIEISRLCQDMRKIGNPATCDELCREFVTVIDEYVGQTLRMPEVWVAGRESLLDRIKGYGWDVVPTGPVYVNGRRKFPHALIRIQSYSPPYRVYGRDDVPTFTPGPYVGSWAPA